MTAGTFRRVIFIEPDPADERFIEHYLREQGYRDIRVTTAASAASLVDELDRKGIPPPHLILINSRLKGVSAMELLRRLKRDARWCAPPVVVLAEDAAQNEIDKLYAHQAACVLNKPANLDQLEQMLRAAVMLWFAHARLPFAY